MCLGRAPGESRAGNRLAHPEMGSRDHIRGSEKDGGRHGWLARAARVLRAGALLPSQHRPRLLWAGAGELVGPEAKRPRPNSICPEKVLLMVYTFQSVFFLSSPEDMFTNFLERGQGRGRDRKRQRGRWREERGRERNTDARGTSVGCLLYVPCPGIEPAAFSA